MKTTSGQPEIVGREPASAAAGAQPGRKHAWVSVVASFWLLAVLVVFLVIRVAESNLAGHLWRKVGHF